MSPLVSLLAEVAPYESKDLLAKVAALQLVPSNASRLIRLNQLAAAIASRPVLAGRAKISAGGLKRLARSEALARLGAHQEDRVFAPFSECVLFFGGDYVVLPGLQEHATFIVKAFATGMFLKRDTFGDHGSTATCYQLLRGVLALSNELARRAGITRNTPAQVANSSTITVPDASEVDRLAGCVVFKRDELGATLARHNLPAPALDAFMVDAGRAELTTYTSPEDSRLLSTPLVAFGDDIVVAAPTDLLAAWMRRVVGMAQRSGLAESVAERFCDGVWRTVQESMFLLSGTPVVNALPEPPGAKPWREMLYATDSDKATHVILVTDPLDDSGGDDANFWETGELGEIVQRRLEEVNAHCAHAHPRVNELVHLVLFQSMGRWMMLGLPHSDLPVGKTVVMTANELSIIATLDPDPMTLRNFVNAADRFALRTEIHSFSTLDTYHLYRSRGQSFYLSDGPPVHHLSLLPNEGDLLACEMLTRRDFHGAISIDGGTIEVTRKHDSGAIPIYFAPTYESRSQLALLVEGCGLPIWVVAFTDGSSRAAMSVYRLLVDAVAYWLWQFTSSLHQPLGMGLREHDKLIIEIRVKGDEEWVRPPQKNSALDDAVEIGSDGDHGRLTVTVSPSLTTHLKGNDNVGERELMRRVLRGVSSLCLPAASLSESAINACIDRHAPLGPKKMCHLLEADRHPTLRPAARGRVRLVQAAVEQMLLDDIGHYLRNERGVQTSPCATAKEGTALLNHAVEYVFGRLERLVSKLSPLRLIEGLLEFHERLIRERDYHAITLANRLACYSNAPELAADYAKEGRERGIASVAIRFLIEYVAARPPEGIRPFSLSVFDELMAMAATIIHFGTHSDYLDSGLVELKVSMLESGRVGIGREALSDVHDKYSALRARGDIDRKSATAMSSDAVDPYQSEQRAVFSNFVSACRSEFGVGFDEILAVTEAATAITPRDAAVCSRPLNQAVREMAEACRLPSDRVSAVVEMLSLRPRNRFLKPPPPFAPRDVYPWRYTRPLSHARRPFVIAPDGSSERLVWGAGHVSRFPGYFHDIVLSERLQASTQQMREAVGRAVNLAGKRFAHEVAEVCRSFASGRVFLHVGKIGAVPIADADRKTLGDIDVLAVDARRHAIYVIECKDLESARTPRELANEIAKLMADSSTYRSTSTKHLRRMEWVRANIDQVLAMAGEPNTGRWRVRGGIVTSIELLGPLLKPGQLPVASLAQVKRDGLQWCRSV